jgi:hypothetical protein
MTTQWHGVVTASGEATITCIYGEKVKYQGPDDWRPGSPGVSARRHSLRRPSHRSSGMRRPIPEFREVIDPDGGMHHWIHIDHYRLKFEGQNTGYVWRYNDTTMRESQWYETATEYGPDSWMYLNEHVRIIGRDGAPSFSANNVIRLTVNANGDLVAYHERLEPLCDGSF